MARTIFESIMVESQTKRDFESLKKIIEKKFGNVHLTNTEAMDQIVMDLIIHYDKKCAKK